MRKVGSEINETEEIMLSQVAKNSTAIASEDTSGLNSMKALINYSGAFLLQYEVRLENARTRGIVDDAASSECHPMKSGGTFN